MIQLMVPIRFSKFTKKESSKRRDLGKMEENEATKNQKAEATKC
jgi:hypothetical protein